MSPIGTDRTPAARTDYFTPGKGRKQSEGPAKALPRIVHVITRSGGFGGAQRNTLLTLQGLAGNGHEVELVCGLGERLVDEARQSGLTVRVIPELVREFNPIKDLSALFKLCRLFRSGAVGIVHTHCVKAGLIGRLAAWLAGVPVIIHTYHGVPFELGRNLKSKFYLTLERLAGLITRRMICVGEVLRKEVAAWRMVPEEKLLTIYSGIDFSSYVPKRSAAEVKRELGLDNAWPVIGCVGRLSEQKSQHFLIEALSRLSRKYPKIRLLLIGDGERRPQLEQQTQALGLSSHVLFLGERNDIPDLLPILDVYAMSSLWEGVGRAMTEAMYAGLPVVVSNVNGVSELVIHEQTGLLVPPRAPEALAAAVDRLASDPKIASFLGANARRKAIEQMDGESMVRDIENLYAALISVGPEPRPSLHQV